MSRAGTSGLAALAALAALTMAGAAEAQMIKPLEVVQDGNGVDLLSGQMETPLPVLSIPAAPNLRFRRIQDLQPVLTGTLIPEAWGAAVIDVNPGGLTSEHFDCDEQGDCRSKKGNGSALAGSVHQDLIDYHEGGTARIIRFNLRNFPSGVITSGVEFNYSASYIQYPDGERIDFTYDTHVTQSQTGGQSFVNRRASSLVSSLGYTLTLTYQSNTGGTDGWGRVAQATIHATGSPSTPLARLTYSGNTITDLGGRQWTCVNCPNALGFQSQTSVTSLRLPGEAADTLQASTTSNLSCSVHQSPPVTTVRRDGVDWNYAYVAGQCPWLTFSRVTTTGPDGFSRIVNVFADHDKPPRITSVADSLGRTTSYLYDDENRPIRVTYPEGNRAEVAYDAVGNIVARALIAKPGSGLADLVETAFYTSAQFCWQPTCFRPVWTRDALNRQTDYTWHSSGQLLTRLEPADGNGQRRKTINEYANNGAWRLVRERVCMANSAGAELTCGTAAEQVRQFTYWGATGLPLTETLTDGAGTQSLTTTYAYDPAGRVTMVDGPLPGTDDAAYSRYDVYGRRTWEIGALGANGLRNARRFTYRNADDKVTAVEEGTVPNHTSSTLTVHRRTDTAYDARRNPARATVSSGGTSYALVQRTFDLSNRLECEARRMNPAAFGSLPASACTLGTEGSFGPDRIARNVWDAAGQLLQEQRAVGTALQQNYATYTYSANGLRRTVTDANGNRAELRYNGHDRLVRWVFPSRTTPGALNEADYEAYTYDAAGNRLTLRKRDGKTIAFLYDNLNRVTRKTVPASASGAAGYSVFYGYDIGNRQTFARFGSASPSQPGITNSYDTLGRLTSSSSNMGGTTRTLAYQVDVGGRRTRLTFPDGQYFTYDHSPAGELTAVRENGGTAVATFAYDAVSRPSAQAFAGASATFQYDPISRLSNLTHDLAGTAADNAATFAYNPASQIVIRTGSNDAYAAASQPDVTRAYTINGLNQYTSVSGTAIGYDNNGNLSSDGGSTYVYDSENRLVSVGGGSSATLSYDPMGRLFQTVGGGVTTRFLYDGDELVAEYDGAGNLLRRYVHGLGVDDPVLWYEGAGLTSAARRSIQRNHQGSIVAAADSSGAAVGINAYDPWGIPNAGNQGRFGYTGQIWLPEIGMWHYKARVYAPTLGRFMQTDPVGYDDQVNLYSYVGNDPVNSTDPSGRVRCTNDPRCVEVHAAAAQARARAQSARAALRDLSDAVRSGATLTPAQAALQAAFEQKFGTGSATVSALNRASNFFGTVADRIGAEGQGARIRFRTSQQIGNAIARAPLNGSRIDIGPAFFGLGTGAGGISQSFVLLHEGGHLAGRDDQSLPVAAGPLGRVVDGIRRAYGTGATDWLGQHDPNRARRNNDSYMCFADPECGGPPPP